MTNKDATGLEETPEQIEMTGKDITGLEETPDQTEMTDVTDLEETPVHGEMTDVIGLQETPEQIKMMDKDATGLEETPEQIDKTGTDVIDMERTPEQSKVPGSDETGLGILPQHSGMRGSEINLTDFEADFDVNVEEVDEEKETNDLVSLSDEKMLQGITLTDGVFERRSFLSRSWSNSQIKEIRPKNLNCSSFEELLAESIPCLSPRINNSERSRPYQESSSCSDNFSNVSGIFVSSLPSNSNYRKGGQGIQGHNL